MTDWKVANSLSFDEARALGVPEQVIQDAQMVTDREIWGTSFGKIDRETGVFMRVDPRKVSLVDGRDS